MCLLNAMLIAASCAVVSLVVAQLESEERAAPPLLLEDVLNKTMCPMRIEYDDNPERVPRLIKHIKCANPPTVHCAQNKKGCCKHSHQVMLGGADDLRFETHCVEVQDTVQVTYRSSPLTIRVAVGCTCMLQGQHHQASCAVVSLVVAQLESEERADPPHRLEDVLNMTMCPIRVFYDDNVERVPRLIKHLKCADTPNIMCAHSNLACCKHHHHVKLEKLDLRFVSRCVEIEDTVLVTYLNNPLPQSMQVSVGCSCLLQPVTDRGTSLPSALRSLAHSHSTGAVEA